jgi:integrase
VSLPAQFVAYQVLGGVTALDLSRVERCERVRRRHRLAISAGANVNAVQRMLGNASAAMTLDTYADLFPDDLDQVADALDAGRGAADFLRTDGQ